MSAEAAGNWLQVVEILIVLIGVVVAVRNLTEFTQSRAIDFVIEAESKIDPLRHSLIGQSPDLIKRIYSSYHLEDLSDVDVQTFPFMQSTFSHVSRLYFLLGDPTVEVGLSPQRREEMVDAWIKYLATFRDHPGMRKMYAAAVAHGDFNPGFMARVKREFEG